MEVSTRKLYFIEEEDDGLASPSQMETGVSNPSCYNSFKNMNQYHLPQSYYYNQYSVSSPRSVAVSRKFNDFRFDNSSYGQQLPHFLDSCFLCKKRIGDNRDIFMYRGDTPFCSEECREEQIERDEAKEKKQSLSSSLKAMRRNEKRSSSSSSSSPTRSRDYAFHNGTIVAA